jgi:hypothetical protein
VFGCVFLLLLFLCVSFVPFVVKAFAVGFANCQLPIAGFLRPL